MQTVTTPKTRKVRKTRNAVEEFTNSAVGRLTKAKRLQELQSLVKLCFIELEAGGSRSDKSLAADTGLCVSTIYKLRQGGFTLRVQFRTVQNLAIAAGLRVQFLKSAIKITVVED